MRNWGEHQVMVAGAQRMEAASVMGDVEDAVVAAGAEQTTSCLGARRRGSLEQEASWNVYKCPGSVRLLLIRMP